MVFSSPGGRHGWEGNGKVAARTAVGVRGEERGEELEVCRGRDHGEAEAARRQEGSEVEERQRVALRGEGDDKHVRRRLGGRGRLHGWGLCGRAEDAGWRDRRDGQTGVSFSPPVETC